MAEEAIGTPLSVRRPRLGMPRRPCFTTPLVRLQQDKLGTTTPTDQAQDTPRAMPLSTNTRKRIGLSRIRKELTKKRLEFPAVSEHKELTPKSKDNKPLKTENKNKERKEQDDEVEPQVGKKQDDEKRQIVEDQEDDEEDDQEDDEEDDQEEMEENDEVEPQDSRIPELQADIETWRRGFIATVNDLQAMVDPRPTKKNMLIHLGIPLEMLRYLEED